MLRTEPFLSQTRGDSSAYGRLLNEVMNRYWPREEPSQPEAFVMAPNPGCYEHDVLPRLRNAAWPIVHPSQALSIAIAVNDHRCIGLVRGRIPTGGTACPTARAYRFVRSKFPAREPGSPAKDGGGSQRRLPWLSKLARRATFHAVFESTPSFERAPYSVTRASLYGTRGRASADSWHHDYA